MAKSWKTLENKYLDVESRDSPCIFTKGNIFIGNVGSTHATLVQEIIYGMDFIDSDNYYDMYKKVWNEKDEDEKQTTISYFRADIENEEDYIFGHRIGNSLYWDMQGISIEIFKNLLAVCNKDKSYKHYSYGDYLGGNEVKELKNYRHKTQSCK